MNSGDRGDDSLPLAWDKLIEICRIIGTIRFTPTRVGQTSVVFFAEYRLPIHSHSRGTDTSSFTSTVRDHDSFPLAWDRLNFLNKFIRVLRFIPTRVGQAQALPDQNPYNPIHSHSRGTGPINVACVYSLYTIYCAFLLFDISPGIFEPPIQLPTSYQNTL